MKSDIDEVALQGIEFWSNVCDEEMDLAIEASEVSCSPAPPSSLCSGLQPSALVQSQASEQGRPPEHTSKFYAKGALQYLVPILTQTLTKQVSRQPPRRRAPRRLTPHASRYRTRTTTTTTGTPARRRACA